MTKDDAWKASFFIGACVGSRMNKERKRIEKINSRFSSGLKSVEYIEFHTGSRCGSATITASHPDSAGR